MTEIDIDVDLDKGDYDGANWASRFLELETGLTLLLEDGDNFELESN